ncbi:hypothetical protein NDU88_006451 [Pleurodeles waltl]|uniref:Uncharacterized protein n=1 Tax=Pleurodeles waltl TaxID=8319 RepID=A0AAV7NRZ5_PLEWA|nr:hypothetical protein NDU88_006451 [Pleurodeles waltl]
MKAYVQGITAQFIYKKIMIKQDRGNQLAQAILRLKVALASAIRYGCSDEQTIQAQLINRRSQKGENIKEKVGG